MEEKNLTQIKFGSFIKLSCAMFLGLGMGMGILFFIMSLLGIDVTANIGSTVYSGVTAGVISLFLGPLLTIVFGVFFGVVGFLPFKFFLKLIKGIKLKLEFR